MLIIKNLKKIYKGTTKGIKGISLTLNDGDICAFIGSNGAGKTTTLKSIVGIHSFDTGEVILNGINLKKDPKKFKQMIAYSPDNPDVYENIRGFEYLNFIGSIYNVNQVDFDKEVNYLSEKLEMKNNLGDLISSYSHGMKQRLVLISVFLHNPDLIVLDEPFVGLDPNATYFLTNELQKRASKGVKIIYATHVLEVAEKICNRVVLIDNGEMKINEMMNDAISNGSLGDLFRKATKHD